MKHLARLVFATLLFGACGSDEARSSPQPASPAVGDTTDVEGPDAGTVEPTTPDTASPGAGLDGGQPDAAVDDAGTEPDAAVDDAGTEPDAAVDDAGTEPDAMSWPPPLPELTEELPPACQAAIDDPYYFQFLDDLCDSKVHPTWQDRSFQCPSYASSPQQTLADGSVVTFAPSSEPVVWEASALTELVPEAMEIAVILIRRVDGVPHYRYLSNGRHAIAVQPWSTTKFLAAANAAASLRIASDYLLGLPARAGDDGPLLGDLVTAMHTYDEAQYSSNGLGRYFHDIGGRARANDLIHALWLERPAYETFGGNYGAAAPALGYTFTDGDASVSVSPDTTSGPPNALSMWTLAESLKRLVLHIEEPEQRLPGIQSDDVKALLYGAEGSAEYGLWGGMTSDTAVYLQAGHDIDYLDTRSQGRWTIFSKLGLGTQGQFSHVGYACWPVLDAALEPVDGLGTEVVIASHLDATDGGDTWDARDRLLATIYRRILLRVVDGRL